MSLADMHTALYMSISLRTTSEIITAVLRQLYSNTSIKYVAEFRAYRRKGVSLPAALEHIENGAKATGDLTRSFVFTTIVFTFILYTLHS
jgi:hypothetical protein